MPIKHHKPEQIIAKLRQIEVFTAQGIRQQASPVSIIMSLTGYFDHSAKKRLILRHIKPEKLHR